MLRRHTPSIELLNPIRLRTPGHQTINKYVEFCHRELLPDLCQINKDFSVQGHSRYSSLAHALSRCVTPAHSPDQVGRSNAFAYPQSSHVSRDVRWILSTFIAMSYARLLTPTQTFPVRDANPVHIGPQLVTLALSQNPATKIKAHTPHKAHACPNCKKKFQRRQELMRHLLSNLPHWILCPFPRCPWVGNRRWNLKAHLRKAHPKFNDGREPEDEETQIYDPDVFVESMARGTLTVASAADTALSMVKNRFAEPDKAGLKANVWSSRRKVCTEGR